MVDNSGGYRPQKSTHGSTDDTGFFEFAMIPRRVFCITQRRGYASTITEWS